MDNNILECIKKYKIEGTLGALANEYTTLIPENDYELIALCAKIAEASTGLIPSNNQLYAAYKMYQGKVIEMPTGDGKTLAGLITLLAWLKDGRRATYVTSNDYLAHRDYSFFSKTLEHVKKEVVLLTLDTLQEEVRSADLVVSDNTTLISNFLLNCSDSEQTYYLTDCILIDEFDTVLIDNAREPSRIAKEIEYDLELFDKIYSVTEKYKNDTISAELINKMVLEAGMNFKDYTLNKKYVREILLDCIDAWKLKEDVDYIVDGKMITLLDRQGRRTNKGYSRFVQLAVEKRHGLAFSKPKNVLIGISYEGLINLYEGIVSGMSGTLDTEADFIESHYGLELEVLQADIPSKRRILPDVLIMNGESEMLTKIVQTVELYSKRNNPILIFAQTISESENISQKLNDLKIKHVLLNAKNSTDEADIISKAGTSKTITIMTTMAGRGTDIVVDELGKKDGGLVILSTGHLPTERLDKQLIGRTGRRGDPGLVQFFSRVSLSPQEMKVIEMASKMSIEEAQDKLRDMVRTNLLTEQNMKDSAEHKVRDYLSCYYKVIDSQISSLLKSKNAILEMSSTELESYILELFDSEIVRSMLRLRSDDMIDDLELTRLKLSSLITAMACDHYNTLTQYMKHSSFLQKHLPDPFSNFQRMAISSYEDLLRNYRVKFVKVVSETFANGINK